MVALPVLRADTHQLLQRAGVFHPFRDHLFLSPSATSLSALIPLTGYLPPMLRWIVDNSCVRRVNWVRLISLPRAG